MAGGVNYIPGEFGKPQEYCHPHHRIPTDLEPAFVIGKDESCCPPTGDPCECVTSGDIEKWNFVYDNFSALADIDVSAINNVVGDVSALNSSADNWNSTFETVSANSANWNIVNELKTSAEDHEERIGGLEEFADETEDKLSAIDSKLNNLHFDNDITDPDHSISGDGSLGAPYGVNNYAALKTSNDNYEELNRHIIKFTADGVNNTLYEFDGAAYNVARIDTRLSGIDQTDAAQNSNIQRNYELIAELANRQKDKQDKLTFGYNSSGYIVTINNSAIGGTGGGGVVLTGDAQGALDQVYANSGAWNEVTDKVDSTTFYDTVSALNDSINAETSARIEDVAVLSAAIDAEIEERTESDEALSAAIDDKQRKLEAGQFIDIASGENADIISVTGLKTFTYFSADYGSHKSNDYFSFHNNTLSANSAIGYLNLSIGYKLSTNTAADIDTLYSAGVNINNINVDIHYLNGMVPGETYYISKNILNDTNQFVITFGNDPEIDVQDITITCVGFMGEPDSEHENVLGINGKILTFNNTSALRL